MASIDFLFSTFEERIDGLLKNLPGFCSNRNIIIVHQTQDPNSFRYVKEYLSDRDDVQYIQQNEYGVTKSRNLAIKYSSSDYVLFCDDDVVYEDNVTSILLRSMVGCDACTFRISSTAEGYTKDFKNYEFTHSRFSILSVGTIEIACDRAFLIKYEILFPEELGAGAKYPSCDEPVFLSKILANGGVLKYKPVTICSHPPISSGIKIDTFESLLSRAIAFKYIFGSRVYIAVFVLFWIKNIRRIDAKLALYVLLKIFRGKLL
ncbi:MAG: glycosyltransferase [Thalassolituus maritimus]|uniref:Glycosyl transferase family 2 n=1 Tax=Thalassolituus maritimus TaxID=484498 RepID=A0A1N7N3U6_9GAMM|nr:glycosyltransferase family A protein [Thalassolituus maritimus]TPD55167.1 MAG: glycosyltransferase [Thalassolituus maritimus]SIS93010.1 Glycosyl transferase family 2 [Thalassolituus maritimus]